LPVAVVHLIATAADPGQQRATDCECNEPIHALPFTQKSRAPDDPSPC